MGKYKPMKPIDPKPKEEMVHRLRRLRVVCLTWNTNPGIAPQAFAS